MVARPHEARRQVFGQYGVGYADDEANSSFMDDAAEDRLGSNPQRYHRRDMPARSHFFFVVLVVAGEARGEERDGNAPREEPVRRSLQDDPCDGLGTTRVRATVARTVAVRPTHDAIRARCC
jgi:hypothetical protein